MFGLASARGVAAIRAGSRLSPQTIAYLHSASITPLTIAAAPKSRIVSVAVGQLGLRGYATQQNGSSGGSGGSGSGSSGSSGGKHESKEELSNRLTREARQRGRAFDQTHDHVGPFPLGVGPSGRTKTWKPWGDSNSGGKLVRTVRQSGNLLVVLLGGGLFVVLALALSTESFAKNSPAVSYSECIDMIRDTDASSQFLLPPLKFTHSPNAASPVRGSSPVVHRVVRSPSSGRDHLSITFWVHGRGKDDPEPSPVRHWFKEKWDGFYAWAQQKGGLLGLATDPDTPEPEDEETSRKLDKEAEKQEGWLKSLASSLSLRPKGQKAAPALPPPGTFTIGECHADYVKDDQGQYQMLSSLVDVPSSRAKRPYQAVVYWSPEANREGLVPRR